MPKYREALLIAVVAALSAFVLLRSPAASEAQTGWNEWTSSPCDGNSGGVASISVVKNYSYVVCRSGKAYLRKL